MPSPLRGDICWREGGREGEREERREGEREEGRESRKRNSINCTESKKFAEFAHKVKVIHLLVLSMVNRILLSTFLCFYSSSNYIIFSKIIKYLTYRVVHVVVE